MKLRHHLILAPFATAGIALVIVLTLVFWPESETQTLDNYDYSALEGIEDTNFSANQNWLRLRDGLELFYRLYPSSDSNTILILVHGSGTESRHLEKIANQLSSEGLMTVVTPDMRGHGESAEVEGDISYIGQYDDDVEDLIEHFKQIYPASKILLGGHSSGGGLVLRYAGNASASKADGYIWLAPYLGHDAPTTKPNSGDWVTVNVKRWVGLSILNGFGVKRLNGLPVLRFNRPEEWNDPLQVSHYSYRLATSFATSNYSRDVAKIDRPGLVLVGSDDESFYPEAYSLVFAFAEEKVDVEILPQISHIGITRSDDVVEKIEHWYAKTYTLESRAN